MGCRQNRLELGASKNSEQEGQSKIIGPEIQNPILLHRELLRRFREKKGQDKLAFTFASNLASRTSCPPQILAEL